MRPAGTICFIKMNHFPPIPTNETARLAALKELCLLDTPNDPVFDQMTVLAAKIFGTSMALISLVDKDRQWFKSKVGIAVQETPRSQAFCAYALHSVEPMVVLDTLEDVRFVDNELVTGSPNLRFYAGAQLMTESGMCLGTFCVLDSQPRAAFSAEALDQLKHFARLVMLRVEALRSVGFVDQLTQLPNRNRFIENAMVLARDGEPIGRLQFAVAVDFCSLSYLQKMQAAIGADYASGFVVCAAERICSMLNPTPAYRIDSTVFAWVCEAASESSLAVQLRQYVAQLAGDIEYRGIPHTPSLTLAVVQLPHQAGGADLGRALDSALEHARVTRAPWIVYHPSMDAAQQRAFHILDAIPAALASADQLHVVYQPKVSLANGRVTGAEALLRWTHPQLGVIHPGEFIPLAETTAIIRNITKWVARTVVVQIATWAAAGRHIVISMNVSALDLENEIFVDFLDYLILLHDIDADLLEVEFTESAIAEDPETVRHQLLRLRALGVRVAIDDFGSGYSNLGYLKHIPATILKIDQSFIRAFPMDRHDEAIVRSIISLGHEFEHQIIAEGIETRDTFEMLKRLGCDEGQGYWIGKPMTVDVFEQWMRRP
jgi:EAL domain-containing protein (putative c-di-GMP-specific phosphodiesterase class I)